MDTCDIVDDDRDLAVSEIVGEEGSEPFLAGGVPDVEADGLVLDIEGLGNEVNPDSWLSKYQCPEKHPNLT